MKIACAVDEIRSLTPDEIKVILDKDEKGEFVLLDVRQPEEYEAGHIPVLAVTSSGMNLTVASTMSAASMSRS